MEYEDGAILKLKLLVDALIGAFLSAADSFGYIASICAVNESICAVPLQMKTDK